MERVHNRKIECFTKIYPLKCLSLFGVIKQLDNLTVGRVIYKLNPNVCPISIVKLKRFSV